jgi:hypothetical protein
LCALRKSTKAEESVVEMGGRIIYKTLRSDVVVVVVVVVVVIIIIIIRRTLSSEPFGRLFCF